MPDMKTCQIPLSRNIGFTAHLREDDYAVIFTHPDSGNSDNDGGNDSDNDGDNDGDSDGDNHSSQRLFTTHQEELARRQPRIGRGDNKRTVTSYFVLTDKCNLACEYCDVLGPSNQRKPGSTMTWEVAERGLQILFGRLADEPDLHAQVTFFGGEPLLAWSLLTRICEYIAVHPDKDRVARMLVTNGILIDPDRAAFLRDHRVYVVVSLDGGPQVNDGMRSHSYESVASGLDCLHMVMPAQFGISCTVGSHNGARISQELLFLQERFKPLCIGLNIYHYQRDGTSPIRMDPDALGDAMLNAFQTARDENIAIYQFIGILKAFSRRYRNLDYCPACVDKLLFTPGGHVGRCETLMNDPRFTVPLEEVRNHQLGPKLDWTRYTPEHEPVCQNCATRWICPGSCAYDMLVTTGHPQGVDERRCRFHTRLLVEMLDLLLESCNGNQHGQHVIIPDQPAFDSVVGGMPTSFPPDTIWIVSLSNVTANEESQAHETRRN